MPGKKAVTQISLLCICLSVACGKVYAEPSFWQESERKAISLQGSDPLAAIEMYRLAIKDAASENAPIEKRLGLLLECGNLLYSTFRSREARDVYDQGAALAQENALPHWQARFLLMTSRNAHELFKHGMADTNDPAPAVKALELRPGDPHTSTDFRVSCLEAIGDAYLDRKDHPSAEKYLTDALFECERLPDEQDRVDEITRSYLQLRIDQHKYASATALLVASAESHPREVNENKVYYASALDAMDPEVTSIRSTVERLIEKRDYAGLDSYGNELRLSSKHLASGGAPIDEFLSAIDLPNFASENEWKDRLKLVNDWLDQRPNSGTAKIVLADLLTSYAWVARGCGWSDTVTEQGWLLMGNRLSQAWKILYRVTPRTPDWYPVAQRIAMGQSWHRPQYDTLVAEARKAYPNYDTVLFDKAYWLQPKWFGKPGEVKSFIDAESNKHPGIDGDIMYAQFAWQLDFSFQNVIKDASFDWTRVKRGLTALIKRHPDSLSARAELAYLSIVVGDKAAALAAFPGQTDYDAPMKMRPRGYLIALEQGEQLQKSDKRPEAIAAYSKAIALDPSSGEAYHKRSEMYVMTNRSNEALADINTCLSMFPAWAPALGERSRIENLDEEYPQSIADVEKALALDPTELGGLSTLGHDYDAIGDHQRALDAANYDFEMTGQKATGSLYYAYQDRGLVWSNAHQYEQAVADLSRGLQLRPKYSQLWAYLAYVYAATDQIDKAEQAAKILFATESFPPRGYRLRAEMYRAAGLWEKALADYDKSTGLEPTYGPGFWQRAVTKIALGRYEGAEADLNKSVALVPSSALAFSYLAFVDDLLGKSDLAQTRIAKAFALTPNLPMNYVNRARIEFHHGDLAKAAADCDKALALDSYLADAYATAAVILASAGKNESSQAFEKTAKTMWWHPWPVPLPAASKTAPAEIAITMPTLTELKPQPFAVAVRDAAP